MKKKTSKKVNPRIVVIGASAGGLKAISSLIGQLPKDFPAPILIVQHISPDASGNVLLNALNKLGSFKCEHAIHHHKVKKGTIYLAPSDHHLMIKKGGVLLVTKGAMENRARPGIDPLFRSAATAFGNKCIAIILSGYLDDGTVGMQAVQRCGGICIVQEPKDAEYPDMPKNVMNQIKVDHCLPVSQMGALLSTLVLEKLPKSQPIPADIVKEAEIAEQVLSDLAAVNSLGEQVPFNCPGCGGVLWKITKGGFSRYRCHTGHAYTTKVLIAEQTKKIEETMWAALRMFEERRNLLTTFATEHKNVLGQSAKERANSSQVHIDRIRAILLADDNSSKSDSPV